MVTNKPRFGGGSSMENTKTQQTGSTIEDSVIKMDDTCQYSPSSILEVPSIKTEEIQQPSQASGFPEGLPIQNSSTQAPGDIPLSKSDGLVLKVDDKQKKHGDIFSLMPTFKEGDEGSNLFTDSEQVQGHGDILDNKYLLPPHQYGVVRSVYQKEAGVEVIQDDALLNAFRRPGTREDISRPGTREDNISRPGTREDNISRPGTREDNISRLRILLEVFESLGIHRHVTLYNRLSHQDKNYWSAIFKEILGKAFCPSDSQQDRDVVYCKNLFLKDRKGQMFIVIADETYTVDLKKLKRQMNAARNLSFATVDDLTNVLQIKPGEVTPFTIMQESAKDVRVVFHESLQSVYNSHRIKMAFHPFSPLLQVDVLFSELILFMKRHGKEMEILGGEKEEGASTTANIVRKKDNLLETTDTRNNLTAQIGNRGHKVVHSDRKGKLKSYIRKNESRIGKGMDMSQTEITKTKDEETAKSCRKEETAKSCRKEETAKSCRTEETAKNCRKDNWKDEIPNDSLNSETDSSRTECRNETSSTKMTPEIETFYHSLRDLDTIYREVSVSSSSKEIGPALGVRCFLMQDRHHNYYVIVSHEFYELDYGRLKKSLHPKKKLDECDMDYLPSVIGVDCQHFTPFALMTSRAKANKVQVFLTEKIVPDNIVLCIQHPFGPGRRILMKSSELQRWLECYCYNNAIGIVQEKPWPPKYNRAFSQFDGFRSDQEIPCITLIAPPRHHRQNHLADSANANVLQPEVTYDDTNSKHQPNNVNSDKWILANILFLQLKNIFSNPLNKICHNGRHSSCHGIRSGDHDVINTFGQDEGSSVDPDVLPGLQTRPSPSYTTRKQGEQSLLSGDDANKRPINTKRFQSQTKFESNRYFLDSNGNSLPVNEVTRHLDLYDVSYFVKTVNDVTGNDVYNDDIDDDSTWQVCHTLHLRDQSGLNNYIIIGRFSEQISVKRFCRRFQIPNRLFIINENKGESMQGDTLETLVTTNPFYVFLTSGTTRDPQPIEGVKVKHRMVLFSSIYMDPDMTCVFPVEEERECLCITSQELENYAKRVGMEVWYMP